MNPLAEPYARRLESGRFCLLHAGHGEASWHGGCHVVAEGPRTWWLTAELARPLPWARPRHVLEQEGELHAWLEEDDAHVVASPDGWHVCARWQSIPGPQPLFQANGTLYRRQGDRVVAVDVARARWMSGVDAVLGGTEEWAQVGAVATRTPRPMPAPLHWETVRVHGTTVSGITADHEWVEIELGTMTSSPTTPMVFEGYSPARWQHWLAGPGGVVWSLVTGRPQFNAPRLALGTTVGTPSGFLTVDWDTNEAWLVSFDGEVRWRSTLPLEPDDTVVCGTWHDGAVHLGTALGVGLRVHEGQTDATEAPAPSGSADPLDLGPAGWLAVAGQAVVGDHRFGWTEDGWLVAVPVS